METDKSVALAHGEWIATLAPWRYFLTLTHDPGRLGDMQVDPRRPYHRVGVKRHRRLVREWFYQDVRRLDPTAQLWGELEMQPVSGQAHEHCTLACSDVAPHLKMRQAWYERAGWCDMKRIEGSAISAAAYCAKYASKATSVEPLFLGFGLDRAATFATVAPALLVSR